MSIKVRWGTAQKSKHSMKGVTDPENWWWSINDENGKYEPSFRFQNPVDGIQNEMGLTMEVKDVNGKIHYVVPGGKLLAEHVGAKFLTYRYPNQKWRRIASW